MFSFGILIETRVFGELIPFVVCATTLITEDDHPAAASRESEPPADLKTTVESRTQRIRQRQHSRLI